jgi:hypothetical protein
LKNNVRIALFHSFNFGDATGSMFTYESNDGFTMTKWLVVPPSGTFANAALRHSPLSLRVLAFSIFAPCFGPLVAAAALSLSVYKGLRAKLANQHAVPARQLAIVSVLLENVTTAERPAVSLVRNVAVLLSLRLLSLPFSSPTTSPSHTTAARDTLCRLLGASLSKWPSAVMIGAVVADGKLAFTDLAGDVVFHHS